jgi:hypothetical protein
MFLASPLIGGAVGVTRFQQLFLKSIKNAKNTCRVGRRCVGFIDTRPTTIKSGKTAETKEENLQPCDMAVDFHGKRLPIMKALGIAR